MAYDIAGALQQFNPMNAYAQGAQMGQQAQDRRQAKQLAEGRKSYGKNYLMQMMQQSQPEYGEGQSFNKNAFMNGGMLGLDTEQGLDMTKPQAPYVEQKAAGMKANIAPIVRPAAQYDQGAHLARAAQDAASAGDWETLAEIQKLRGTENEFFGQTVELGDGKVYQLGKTGMRELGVAKPKEKFQILPDGQVVDMGSGMPQVVTKLSVGLSPAQQAADARANAREDRLIAAATRPDTGKNFDRELKLSDRYQRESQSFFEVRKAYDNVSNSLKQNSAVGDLAAATSIMKMLDPTSVVRESELALSLNATGTLDQMINYAQKIQNGQRLNPQQRKEFLALANSMLSTATSYNQRSSKRISDMAGQYGLSVRNIVGEEPPAQPVQPKASVRSRPSPASQQAYKAGQNLDQMPLPSQLTIGTVITVDGVDFTNTGKAWKRAQ